jgi:hypothetical protein
LYRPSGIVVIATTGWACGQDERDITKTENFGEKTLGKFPLKR